MGVGRFICVALPLILTIASTVTLLIATLSGVASKDLFIFSVDLSDLSLNAGNLGSLAQDLGIDLKARASLEDTNITSADVGLDNTYQVTLWGYCTKDNKGHQHCTHPEFDWASKHLNTSFLDDFGSATGINLDIPKDIKDALKAFRTGIKWTEVAYVVALVALGAEIVLGIFATCSRLVSCFTWLVACAAAVLACVAAGATTALAVLVVGAIEGTSKKFGVKASVGTHYLVVVWLAAAFAIGAAATWIFTICCCKPDRHSHKSYKHRSMDGEKLLPSSYSPVGQEHEMMPGNHNSYYGHNNANPAPQYAQFDTGFNNYSQQSYGNARSDLAYEPYSHRA